MENIISNQGQISGIAANTNSGNGANKQNEEKKKRVYKPQPVYRVLKKAHTMFKQQVEQDTEMKKKCIEKVLNSSLAIYPDKLRFSLDFRKERNRLTDSIRFNKDCRALMLSPADVADHVVFEGKGAVEKVIKEGIQVLGENVRMFNAPLWKDTKELYHEVQKEGDENA